MIPERDTHYTRNIIWSSSCCSPGQGLAQALDKVGRERKMGEERGVQYKVINPKALSLGQLYGAYDSFSNEWSDGMAGSG